MKYLLASNKKGRIFAARNQGKKGWLRRLVAKVL